MNRTFKRILYVLLFLVCIPATGYLLLILGWWLLNMGHEVPGYDDTDSMLRFVGTVLVILILVWISVEAIFQPLLKRIHKT